LTSLSICFSFSIFQILFLAGVTMTIGPKRTLKFFIRPRNHKGTACFLGGLTLVFVVGRCRLTYQPHVHCLDISS